MVASMVEHVLHQEHVDVLLGGLVMTAGKVWSINVIEFGELFQITVLLQIFRNTILKYAVD